MSEAGRRRFDVGAKTAIGGVLYTFLSAYNCADCHNENGWDVVNPSQKLGESFHDATRFPLKGLHRDVKCKSCHGPFGSRPVQYKGLAFHKCGDCHPRQGAEGPGNRGPARLTERSLSAEPALVFLIPSQRQPLRYRHNPTDTAGLGGDLSVAALVRSLEARYA